MKYPRRKVEHWKWDALRLSTGILFITVVLSLIKQAIPKPVFLDPTAGKVTIYRVETVKIKKINISEIVDKIHALESSRGKAVYGLHLFCRKKGESNEYGYGAHQKMCFRNHVEATARVHLWFNINLETYTLGQAICRYNTGIPHATCLYYQKFLAVK